VRVRTLFVLFAAVLLLAVSGVALSQTVQGVITGTVTDPTGAVVPNVPVTITNVGTNTSESTVTGSDGSYRFPLVPPGKYIIDVKAPNFAEVRASGIVVEASQTIPFNVKLELAKASQVVEVTEQTVLVQTATSDLSTQIDRTTIENTPLADRDVFSTLPFLAPQVSPGLDMSPTSGGARESGTAYLLNGADDNDNFSEGAINIHPPLESVQDFSILTNTMSAEYGRGAGAVVTANQVSGTNKFHGAVYEFNRNASLNAEDFFSNRQQLPTPKYIRNQFGGIISGPVIKDKTFFSFAYDRIKLLSGTTAANNFVPTSAGVAYLQSNGGPLGKQILSALPPVTSDASCPNQGNWLNPNTGADSGVPITGKGTNPFTGVPNTVGCLSFFDPKTDTSNIYYGRVDHNFSSKDRLSVTVNLYRDTFIDKFGGQPLNTTGATAATTNNHFHQIGVSETHVFSPRLVNEVTVSHNRHYNVFVEGDGKTTIPNIFIDNQNEGNLSYQLGGPFEGGQVQGFTQDRWGASDNLTFSIGRHSLKLGGGGTYGILYRNWDLGLPGQYEFGELITVNGNCPACTPVTPATDPNGSTLQPGGTIANLQDETQSNFAGDYPYFQETSVDPRTGAKASAYRHYTYHDYNAFVQDDWKFSPRLTFNLGLRWDRYGAPAEDHNILAQFTNLGSCNILTASCIAAARVSPVSRMWNTQNHDFAPRIGFAWDPRGDGKMAVRGGFGIYYDRIFDNIWSNGAWNPPFYALLDFEADLGDAVFYSNPASIGAAYDPSNPIPHPGKRVSVRTMDVNMKDSSGDNYYLGVERQFLGNFLFRVNYNGSFGRHLPMLENYNRLDGIGYGVSSPHSLTAVRPNPLYTGFNYRSDSVSSNYNALVAELQKRMSNGLQFQTGYTFSKLLDVNSELFAGCSTIGGGTGTTAPYYYVSNAQPNMYRGPASYDHKHSYKFSVTYEMPFLKSEKGFLGHALGGWSVGSLFQFYSGHPVDVYNGRSAVRARMAPNGTTCTSAAGCLILDQNGVPYNIGGDYNLDGVLNDHPVFTGNVSSFYSGKSPADGYFIDNNRIGCGEAGVPSTVSFTKSSSLCPSTPNAFFTNPAYGTGATPFERFGSLGRGVFRGPQFAQLDLGLSKSFRISETMKLDFKAQGQNILNHPSFECMVTNLNSSDFGKAQCLAQSVSTGLGAPVARVMSLGLRLAF